MTGNPLMYISQDERERAIFRSRRKFEMDFQSDLATAEDKGKEIGKKIGINIGKRNRSIEIARNAIQMNMTIEDIVKLTGLTHEEIQSLSILQRDQSGTLAGLSSENL